MFIKHPQNKDSVVILANALSSLRYGLFDIYDDKQAKQEFETLLASNSPFDTGWCVTQKELYSLRVSRDKAGSIKVEVTEVMDDWDDSAIVDDAASELHRRDELEAFFKECFPDHAVSSPRWERFIQSIQDFSFNAEGGQTEETAVETLPAGSELCNICDCISNLLDDTHKRLQDSFNVIIKATAYHLDLLKEGKFE